MCVCVCVCVCIFIIYISPLMYFTYLFAYIYIYIYIYIYKGNCREINFSFDGNEIPTIHKKVLSVSVAATPYHLLIDIVGRT